MSSIAQRRSPAVVHRPLLVAALTFCSLPLFAASWQAGLSTDAVGPFPEVRPFEAEFKIGWSEIEAARAKVVLAADGPNLRLTGSGGTLGFARLLWQLDATLDARTARKNLTTVYSTQHETYKNRSITTQIVSRPDGIWRLRENWPQGENAARWKRIPLSPLRDLISGMLFIRSQRLEPGDHVSTIIFPGDSPFLTDIRVLGTETISVRGTPQSALKLDIQLQRINLKKHLQLEPHGKFRNGTVWLSNDSDRIPLRAEVNIFIGYVFAELTDITFPQR